MNILQILFTADQGMNRSPLAVWCPIIKINLCLTALAFLIAPRIGHPYHAILCTPLPVQRFEDASHWKSLSL